MSSGHRQPKSHRDDDTSRSDIGPPPGIPIPPEPHTEDESSSSGRLSFGMGFLKGLGHSDKKGKEAQAPKKRGPKPDSKPALTRRQELNRQAQRTHRERKEHYIKSLEEQVMQLREVYTGVTQEKNAAIDENKKLRELLAIHGIPFEGQGESSVSSYRVAHGSTPDYGLSHGFSPQTGPSSHGTPDPLAGDFFAEQQALQSQFPQTHQHHHPHQFPQQEELDYDQVGVDFVLALEAACLDHLQMMCVRSIQDPEPTPNGHAMMITCPPFSHVDNNPDIPYPHKMPDVPKADLIKLLTLSQDLPLDGELTPIMALNTIRNHPRFKELTLPDLITIKDDLQAKTRCYGFGAVLEEFELRDALSAVFATKLESYSVFQ